MRSQVVGFCSWMPLSLTTDSMFISNLSGFYQVLAVHFQVSWRYLIWIHMGWNLKLRLTYKSPMLTPGWEPEGPAQKNSQGVPWILLDISTTFFIPAAVSYMLGLYRNFIRRIPLLSNIKVLHALDSQSHGFLARRDFGTWNSSNRDFGRSVWMALCAIGFQIHRANASHVLGLSRNCTLPCICCPGPIDRKKTSAAKDCNWMRPILYILYNLQRPYIFQKLTRPNKP